MATPRVFISSTAEDLRAWRLAARDVALDAKCHPVLLNEHGGADTRPTVAMCREELASCDLVVLLVAFRRGWVPGVDAGGDGVRSITAIELDHARERDVPVLVFLARDTWPGNRWEPTDEGRAWITDFRSGLGQAATFFESEGPDLAGFRAELKTALAEYRLNLPVPAAVEPRAFHVPFARNTHFTGRDAELTALHRRLNDPASTRVAALTGLGGIGKTQTALEYAYRHVEDYRLIFWLRAEDPTTLAADYADLAAALGLDVARAPDQRDRIRAVRDWLDVHDNWLIVFDNAPGAGAVAEYRPRLGRGHVIVTSRDAGWGGTAVADELTALSVADAAAFVCARLDSGDTSAARAVARTLGGLPLALEQACAFCERTGRTLPQYQALLKDKLAAVLRRGDVLDYPATVASTWELSFQALEEVEPTAVALLRCVAWLSPDRISRSLFGTLAAYLPDPLRAAVEDELAFDDALAELRRYSLVRVEDDALSLHRLVQVITRARMDADTQAYWGGAVLRLLDAGFSHPLSVAEREELHTHVRPAVDAPGTAEPVLAAALLYRLAQHHRYDDVGVAVPAMRDALAVLDAHGLGEGDVSTLIHVELARMLCEEGDFAAGVEHFAAGTRRTVDTDAVPAPFAFIPQSRGVADRRWLSVELRSRTSDDVGEISLALAPDLHDALARDQSGTPLVRQLQSARWQLWQDYGVALPPISQHVDATLPERTYVVSVDHVPVAGMRLPLDARFVHDQRDLLRAADIPFDATVNPRNGRPAAWVADRHLEKLQEAGISHLPPLFVLSLHVQAVLEMRLGEFLSHQDVADLLHIHLSADEAEEAAQSLLTPLVSVIRGLLVERVPVRSVPTIVDQVREGLDAGRSLVSIGDRIRRTEELRFALPGAGWSCGYLRLTPGTEAEIGRKVHDVGGEPVLVIDPELTKQLLAALRSAVAALGPEPGQVALLVSEPGLRVHVRCLVELEFPHLAVVADPEIDDRRRERVLGTIAIEDGVW